MSSRAKYQAIQEESWLTPGLKSFFGGLFLYRIADWFYLVALNWFVLVSSNSAFALAVVNAARLLPALFFSYLGGSLADRNSAKKVLLRLHITMWFSTLLMCLLLVYKSPWWWLAIGAFVRDSFAVMDPPMRTALLNQAGCNRYMPNLLTLNASVLNAGRLVGPVLGGFSLKYLGEVSTLSITLTLTLAYIAILLISPLKIHCPQYSKECKPKQSFAEIKQTITEKTSLKLLFLLSAPVMLFCFPYTSLLPIVARDIHRLDASGFGLLLGLTSIGALTSTLLWKDIAYKFQKGRVLLGLNISFAIFFILSMATHNLAFTCFSLVFVGALGQLFRTQSRSMIQLCVPVEKAGRITAISFIDRSFIPLGTLLGGFLVQQWGPNIGLTTLGVLALISSGLILKFFPKLLYLTVNATHRRAFFFSRGIPK